MAKHDPYGVIVRGIRRARRCARLAAISTAIASAFSKKLSLTPNIASGSSKQRRVRHQRAATSVARPVTVASPSLGNIGAGGGDTQVIEPSDGDLFRAATSARRR
jgi:hypothetical protein